VLTEAVQRAEAIGDESLQASATVELFRTRMSTSPEGVTEDARREAERLIPVLERLGDDAGLAKAWRLMADVNNMECQESAMQLALERAIGHARLAGDRREEAEALLWLATALRYGPTPATEATARLETIVSERPGGPVSQAGALIHLAVLKAMLGRFEEGRRHIDQAILIYEEFGLTLQHGWAYTSLGELELLAGDLEAAERGFRRAYEHFGGLGEKGFLSTIAAQLGEALCGLGRDDEAEQLAVIGEQAGGSDDVMTNVTSWRVRALVCARRGNHAQAERLAREAVALAEPTDALDMRADTLMSLAEVLKLAGKPDEATPVVEHALALYDRKGNLVMTQRARNRLAEARAAAPR
jgi:tetratricopeptide (TPR) repeat protein